MVAHIPGVERGSQVVAAQHQSDEPLLQYNDCGPHVGESRTYGPCRAYGSAASAELMQSRLAHDDPICPNVLIYERS